MTAVCGSVIKCQRAENGALDPSRLDPRFWGAPIFSPEAPKPLFLRVLEKLWGAPNADPTTTDPTPHSRPSKFEGFRAIKRGRVPATRFSLWGHRRPLTVVRLFRPSIPHTPFRTKNSTALESVVVCYCRRF